MHCVPSLLTKNPPKERRRENFSCILGFPVTPHEDEAQVDCLSTGVALSPLVTEKDYRSNNFETCIKSVRLILIKIDK